MNQIAENSPTITAPVADGTAELWRDYRDKLLGFIQSRVESRDVAEDILQDVFVKIQKNLPALQDAGRLESWVYQIVRHAVIDHYRARRAFEELPPSLATPEADEEERARREISGCLAPMIESLPPTYRAALKLSEIDGLKQKQVAAELGLSLSGAKSRVQRGRALVGDMLTDCCRFERDHRGVMTDYTPHNYDCSNCS